MSVFHENMLIGASGQGAAGPTAGRSVRFNSADSAYLSRTPASAGNRKTWTWSGWVKRSGLGRKNLLMSYDGSNLTEATYTNLGFSTADLLVFESAYVTYRTTTQVFRDTSAWYHLVVAIDTTQATANERIKIYVNGAQITAFNTTNNPSLNADLAVNATFNHRLGSEFGQFYFDGYLALVHFIDGQALTPSSFGETSATTGQWIAKTYSGSYGTNGFFLDFLDNSTAAALGYDAAGSNDWTVNNLSVTAGSGNDSLRDHPTSAGTSTGLGGEVSGNYCTWNPLTGAVTLTNGNLDGNSTGGAWRGATGTTGVFSGKWYWESTIQNTDSGNYYGEFGFIKTTDIASAITVPSSINGITYYARNGRKFSGGTSVVTSSSGATTGDIVQVAVDLDAGKIWFGVNNTWIDSGNPASGTNAAYTGLSGTYLPVVGVLDGGTCNTNFGQRAFAYTAPSGFSPLVDTLLPTPTIAKPNTVMDTVLYSANGSTQTISGLNFSPDLVWSKSRNRAYPHGLHDSVRGAYKYIRSSGTNAETDTSGNSATYTLTSFNSDGFSVGADGGAGVINNNAAGATTYAAWAWDCGSSNVSNTSGTITSTVRASTANGCSIVTYTGTGANATVGHGCGTAPSLILCKQLNTAQNWNVYHSSMNAGDYLRLNTADAAISSTTVWNSTAPTSTVFSVGTASTTNGSGGSYVAYCWTPVAGLSSSFSYTGNGAADGPYIHLGFRPAFLLIKQTTAASTTNWVILDSKRLGYNVDNDPQYPNLAAIDGTTDLIDLTANGFKIRSTDTSVNASAGTYVGYAWAEFPFQYARAR